MAYLATKKAEKMRCCYFILPIFLIMVMPAKAQNDTKHLLVIINKNGREVQTNEAGDSDGYKSHQENLERLLNGGYLTPIGFLEKGGGIFIGNKSDQSHIQKVLEEDRMINTGTFILQMKVFDKKKGHFCQFKKGCTEKNYQLIRFFSNLNKETVKIAAAMEYKHQLYLEEAYSGNVILLSGRFQDKDGGFVIFRGKDFKNFVYQDPAVINDYFIPDFLSFTGCGWSDCLKP